MQICSIALLFQLDAAGFAIFCCQLVFIVHMSTLYSTLAHSSLLHQMFVTCVTVWGPL